MDEQYKQCVEYTAAECPSGIGPLCTGKGMGGHPGAFTDITIKMDDKCFTTCGKKLTDETEKEFDFYKSLYTEQNLPYHIQNLKKYMPDFYPNEVCEKKWEEKEKGFLWSSIKKKKGTYFPISNIKLGLGDNQKTLDFKIGKKTAFRSDKGAIGRFRHKILDEEMSRSSEIGFRLEGATEVNGMVEKAKQESEKSGWKDTLIQHEGKKQLQAGLYMLYPEFIWDYFIDNKEEGKKLLIQFKNFESDFIHPNIKAATEHQQSIGFIGSSVLIAKGSDDIKFNIIDFAHPFWDIIDKRTIPRKHKEIVLNYCVGLLSFISRYEQWYKTKFGEKTDETPNPQSGSGRRRTRNRRRRRHKTRRKRRGGTKIKYNFDLHWQSLIDIQNRLEKELELPQGMRIGAIHDLKHILLIRHIQDDLKSNDSKYSGILLESEKNFINNFDTTSEGCCTISGGKKRTRRRRKKRRKKTRKKSGGCWRWPFSCGRKKDDDLTSQQKKFQQQAIENFFSSRNMIRPTNDKDAIKKIQEIQDRERKIQGQINAEKMRREYESYDSSDELLEAWKDEPITGNKEDPREYYSGSTSPNPIARVTPRGYELYVEEPSGKKSPPPEWYYQPKPMRKSPSLLQLPKFKND